MAFAGLGVRVDLFNYRCRHRNRRAVVSSFRNAKLRKLGGDVVESGNDLVGGCNHCEMISPAGARRKHGRLRIAAGVHLDGVYFDFGGLRVLAGKRHPVIDRWGRVGPVAIPSIVLSPSESRMMTCLVSESGTGALNGWPLLSVCQPNAKPMV